ncbi:hypothetical protein Tco_0299139 [Tanacetum coccineum]
MAGYDLSEVYVLKRLNDEKIKKPKKERAEKCITDENASSHCWLCWKLKKDLAVSNVQSMRPAEGLITSEFKKHALPVVVDSMEEDVFGDSFDLTDLFYEEVVVVTPVFAVFAHPAFASDMVRDGSGSAAGPGGAWCCWWFFSFCFDQLFVLSPLCMP